MLFHASVGYDLCQAEKHITEISALLLGHLYRIAHPLRPQMCEFWGPAAGSVQVHLIQLKGYV